MGAGLPIVAGDVGAARDYLGRGDAGLLVPPGDPGALAAAAIRLIDDPAMRARLSAGALAAAQRFRWDALAPTAEAAYAVALTRVRS